jgi:toxin YoeB
MKLLLDPNALADLRYWIAADRRKALKILDLIDSTLASPFEGLGKPEPLKYELQGCWSRRIDQEHRLVYKVEKGALIILACRYHY